MAIKYGTEGEPGVISLIESALSVGISAESPADAALVGAADLTNGSASVGEVKTVNRSSEARDYFGEDSPLTRNCIDALQEGAFPLWAVAVESVDVTGEDLSSLSNNVDNLANAPVEEDAESINFTIGGTDLTTKVVHYEPTDSDPETDEVLVEPTSGTFAIDSGVSVGNSGDSVDYTYHDYTKAIDNLTTGDTSDHIDIVGVLSENVDVQTETEIAVEDMAESHRFAVCFFPAEVNIEDPLTYDAKFDNSRVGLLYPGRDEGEHVIGAYVGMRSRLGIRTTPINKRLRTHRNVDDRLTQSDRIGLIDNFVVPLQSDPTGVKIIDDINTVDPEQNQEETNIRFGYTRLVADYLIRTIQINEERFIGRLNRPAIRNAMKASIKSQLRELAENSQLISFQVNVTAESATKAKVEVGLDLADPLRTVENVITIGE
jgi:hypothetical protein